MGFNGIIISGLPGSGKTTVAQQVAEKHKWKYYSVDDLWRERWKKLYPNEKISFEDYWKKTTQKENLQMNLDMRKIVENGNVVLDGRYARFFDDLNVLRVFVTASLDIRAKRALETEKYSKKSLDEIKKILLEREQEELRVGKEIVDENYDYRDSRNYDLYFDSGMYTIEEEISAIALLIPPPKKV